MTDSVEESDIRRDAIHEEGTYSTVAISRVCYNISSWIRFERSAMHFYFNAKYYGSRNTKFDSAVLTLDQK